MRRIVAFIVGLVLPMVIFIGVAHAATELAAPALVVERVQDAREAAGAPVLSEFEVSHLPHALRDALARAAREGSATVLMSGAVRAAWEELTDRAEGATRFLCDLGGVLVLLEAAPDPGWAERVAGWTGGIIARVRGG